MRIFLLRHGIAEAGKPGVSDRDRALVPEGRRKLREVLKIAKLAEVSPSLIVSSPYRRALETAGIAAQILGYKGVISNSAALVPDAAPRQAWDEIRAMQSQDSLLLAGHEPLYGQLFAYLLASPDLLVDFKQGALAAIDVDSFGPQPRGILRWHLVPKLAGD